MYNLINYKYKYINVIFYWKKIKKKNFNRIFKKKLNNTNIQLKKLMSYYFEITFPYI